MNFYKSLKNTFLILAAALILSACSTGKKADVSGDVYTGTDTVEYLATGVKDRVFFATNKSSLTSLSRETLRKQATYLRKNKNLNVVVEGHADERGTREYNLALGERRANAVKDYLIFLGIEPIRIEVKAFGASGFVNEQSSEKERLFNRRVEIIFR